MQLGGLKKAKKLLTKANFCGIYPKNSVIVATSPIIVCSAIRRAQEGKKVIDESEFLWDLSEE